MTTSPANRLLLLTCFIALPSVAHGAIIQLDTIEPLLRPKATVVEYTSTEDLLPSPLVLAFPTNVVTFTLAVGDWRRADQGVNFIGDFNPGTQLLYTNNNNFLGFDGVTTVGGGGSGPVEITFSRGVRAVGLRAQADLIGPERFTFSVYNGAVLLDTFTVDGVSGQRAEENFAVLIGAVATGSDRITRLAISSESFQGGQVDENRFAIGPVRFVPEPGAAALLLVGTLSAVLRRSRRNPYRTLRALDTLGAPGAATAPAAPRTQRT